MKALNEAEEEKDEEDEGVEVPKGPENEGEGEEAEDAKGVGALDALWKEPKPPVEFAVPKGDGAKGEGPADGSGDLDKGGKEGGAPKVGADDVEAPNAVDAPNVKALVDEAVEAVELDAGEAPKVNGAGAEAIGAVVEEAELEGAEKEPPPKVKGAPADEGAIEEEFDEADDEAAKGEEKVNDDVVEAIEDEDAEAGKPPKEGVVIPAVEAPKVKGADDEGADEPKRGVEEEEEEEDEGRENMEEDDSEVEEVPLDDADEGAAPKVKGAGADREDNDDEEEKEEEEEAGAPKVKGEALKDVDVALFPPSEAVDENREEEAED